MTKFVLNFAIKILNVYIISLKQNFEISSVHIKDC